MNAPTSTALGEQLAAGIDALGVSLPPEATGQLLRYVELLAKWSVVYNLTAIREPERMVTHHLLDSLAALPTLDALAGAAPARILDIGSGAGLPGVPIAVARPRWQVTMAEPVQKKVAFIAQAVAEIGLRNATPSLGRVEDLRSPQPFDLVISRAFSDLASFAEAALPHLAPSGRIVAMKGVHPDEELRELPATVNVERSVALRVPGVDAARHLIVLQRCPPQGKALP